MTGIVVDENIAMDAANGKTAGGALALSEAQFMSKLFDSNHPLFVNTAIAKKYRDIEQKIGMRGRSAGLDNGIYIILMQTLTDSRKINYVDGLAVDWPGLKKCDREFVGVALQTSSMLVTADMKLRKIVEDHPGGSGITCATARHAIGLLDARG